MKKEKSKFKSKEFFSFHNNISVFPNDLTLKRKIRHLNSKPFQNDHQLNPFVNTKDIEFLECEP